MRPTDAFFFLVTMAIFAWTLTWALRSVRAWRTREFRCWGHLVAEGQKARIAAASVLLVASASSLWIALDLAMTAYRVLTGEVPFAGL